MKFQPPTDPHTLAMKFLLTLACSITEGLLILYSGGSVALAFVAGYLVVLTFLAAQYVR